MALNACVIMPRSSIRKCAKHLKDKGTDASLAGLSRTQGACCAETLFTQSGSALFEARGRAGASGHGWVGAHAAHALITTRPLAVIARLCRRRAGLHDEGPIGPNEIHHDDGNFCRAL